MLTAVTLLGAVLGGVRVLPLPPPVVHRLELADRFLVSGDSVLLYWHVEHADRIAVWEGICVKHEINVRSGRGVSPLPLRTGGWLRVEIANHRHTRRLKLGPLQVVKVPTISHVSLPDLDLRRISDARIESLAGLLNRIGERVPSWRTARPPAPPGSVWDPLADTLPLPIVDHQSESPDHEE
ncbi:hypothetical protein GCM10027456_11750 [Kineosporia babensis]